MFFGEGFRFHTPGWICLWSCSSVSIAARFSSMNLATHVGDLSSGDAILERGGAQVSFVPAMLKGRWQFFCVCSLSQLSFHSSCCLSATQYHLYLNLLYYSGTFWNLTSASALEPSGTWPQYLHRNLWNLTSVSAPEPSVPSGTLPGTWCWSCTGSHRS